MEKCFIVVCRDYSEGIDAYAFDDEEKARQSVEEDAEAERISLIEEGYEPVVATGNISDKAVYVPDTDIYYEWYIVASTIR